MGGRREARPAALHRFQRLDKNLPSVSGDVKSPPDRQLELGSPGPNYGYIAQWQNALS